jgi:pimeloyl-ACP methyl ester carboxylesterase
MAAGTPVVFVHGLWLHSSSWQPWMDVFRAAGYEPIAPEWPGTPDTVVGARANPQTAGGFGITEVADHYARIIGSLDAKPVLIGHSFGGLLVQNLLGRGLGVAAVAIDPAPIKGVLALPVSALRVASVALRKPANRKGVVSLTPEQFRYGFSNALPDHESAELYEKWTIPSPGRPLFEAAFANFTPNSPAKVNVANPNRGPLLLVSGGQDHTVPPAIVKATAKLYAKSPAVTDLKVFPDRGHSLTVDHGWRGVADASLTWLEAQTLG